MTASKTAVVITGSRDWIDTGAVLRVLRTLPTGALVIHGDCPTGADACASFAIRSGVGYALTELAMPAQWQRDGKAAGPRRNAAMVRVADALRVAGYAVTCHAFPLGTSPGTRGCVRAFKAAGFDVVDHNAATEQQQGNGNE